MRWYSGHKPCWSWIEPISGARGFAFQHLFALLEAPHHQIAQRGSLIGSCRNPLQELWSHASLCHSMFMFASCYPWVISGRVPSSTFKEWGWVGHSNLQHKGGSPHHSFTNKPLHQAPLNIALACWTMRQARNWDTLLHSGFRVNAKNI